MAIWIEPIVDRTQEDVEFALQKIAEWMTARVAENPLSVYDLKGCLNVTDINRIEGNIAYLGEQLTRYGYLANVATKTWSNNGLPNESDIRRILDSVTAIIESFYQQRNAPRVPTKLAGYEDVNSVEKNLLLIRELLDCMVGSFQKSNSFQSGSKRMLPIRR